MITGANSPSRDSRKGIVDQRQIYSLEQEELMRELSCLLYLAMFQHARP